MAVINPRGVWADVLPGLDALPPTPSPVITAMFYRQSLDGVFEGNPVCEGTTRRGTDIPMHSMEKHADSKHRSTSVLSSLEELERHAEFLSSTQEKA